jgi:hypothetical protein
MKTRPTLVNRNVLRGMPLPLPGEGGDKEGRGRALVVGGGRRPPLMRVKSLDRITGPV